MPAVFAASICSGHQAPETAYTKEYKTRYEKSLSAAARSAHKDTSRDPPQPRYTGPVMRGDGDLPKRGDKKGAPEEQEATEEHRVCLVPFLFVLFSEATADPAHVQIMSEREGEAGREEDQRSGGRCKVGENWQDEKVTLSFVSAAAGSRKTVGGVATLLCSVHAPGISQLADRPHVPCGEAIPENGRGFRGSPWIGNRARGDGQAKEGGGRRRQRSRRRGRDRIVVCRLWKIVECAVRCAEEGRTGF